MEKPNELNIKLLVYMKGVKIEFDDGSDWMRATWKPHMLIR